MKILITYASAGSGHFKAAEALYNYFKSNRPDTDVQLIDILDKSNVIFKTAYSKGYNFLVTYTPWLWSLLFFMTDAPGLRILARIMTFPIDFFNTRIFRYFLVQEDPDAVISTHFLCSRMTSFLKGRKMIRAGLITVVTDFGVHPLWVHPHTDLYVAASEYTRDELIAQGVGESSIKIFGIPVAEKFSEKGDKKTICRKLGISGDAFSVLLITGSFGIGPLEEITEQLHHDVQVLVVCAHNKRLYQRLISRCYPRVKVFGFVNNVEDLMTAVDVIITKPGGLTISEALSMEVPPLFISAIFGQETENARIISEQNAGIVIKQVAYIGEIIRDFKNHPEKLQTFRRNISGIRKPYAARDVCEYVFTMAQGTG